MRVEPCQSLRRWANVSLSLAGGLFLVLGSGILSGKSFANQSEGQEPSEWLVARMSQAPEPGVPQPARLSVGSQDATLGSNVVIPLYFTLPPGVELRKLSAEIEWVSKNLQFVKVERGLAPETVGANVGAKVTQTVKDEKGLEHSTLLIQASVVEENPTRGIPSGLQAYLTFEISTEVQAAAIELRPKLISASTMGTSEQEITQAEIESGKINVELPGLPPYVTCFFFSH